MELKHGGHVCAFYESEEGLADILKAWVEDGLEKGQRILVILDAQERQEATSRLEGMGLDWRGYSREGKLEVLTSKESYLMKGAFRSDDMISLLEGHAHRAAEEGYSGLRVAGEMSWAMGHLSDLEDLIDYEEMVNEIVCGGVQMAALCAYDRRKFAEDFLVKVSITHSHVAAGGRCLPNPAWRRQRDPSRRVSGMGPLETFLQGLEGLHDAIRGVQGDEAIYKAVMDEVEEGVLVLKGGRASLVRAPRESLTGYTDEEVSRMSPRDIVHPQDLPQVQDALDRASAGEGPFELTCRVVRKDGGLRWARIRINVARMEGEDAVVVTFRDVTENRRMQEQLIGAQRMEAVGRLAAGVAHDFNNLMTAVMGYADLLRLRLPAGDPIQRDVEQIRKAGERAASLTKQLLAFSRKQILSPLVLDINEVVRELMRMLERILGEDIEIETFLAEGLDSVSIDPTQLEQVIVNLAVNARDAMPQGGKLTIETANVELDEAYARSHPPEVEPGQYVMLAVTDTGKGMDEATRLRVFEPFFTTKDPGIGTGLGLSTVYGIVRQSGGHIWAYSEPGQGTTFKIYLPKAQGRPGQWKPPHKAQQIPTGSETILVVEDDEAVRRITVEMLNKLGYEVLEASDADQASMTMARHGDKVALLLVDVILPEVNGKELADSLRKQYPSLRVLFMSGYSDNIIAQRGVLKEGVELIPKPFTYSDLAVRVRRVLDSKAR